MFSNVCNDTLFQTALEDVINILVSMSHPALLEQGLCFWEASGCLAPLLCSAL